jgi:hypothetical protein
MTDSLQTDEKVPPERRRSIGGHAASSPFRLFALSSASRILRAIVKLVTKSLDSGPTTMAALQPRRRFHIIVKAP